MADYLFLCTPQLVNSHIFWKDHKLTNKSLFQKCFFILNFVISFKILTLFIVGALVLNSVAVSLTLSSAAILDYRYMLMTSSTNYKA